MPSLLNLVQQAASPLAGVPRSGLTGTDAKLLMQAGRAGDLSQFAPGTPEYEARYAAERAAYDKRHDQGKILGAAGIIAPLALPALGVGAGAGAAGAAATEGAALGSGLTAGTTASGIGGGALGTGLAVPGGVGTGAGLGAGGIAAAAPAGTALAPGFFAAEGVGAAGALGAGTAAGGGGAGSTTGASLAPTGGIGLSQLAAGIPAALGAIGAKQQANAYGDLAGQYMSMGAPYRSRLSDLYNNPDDFLNSDEVQIPVQQATNVLARSLSRQGNPTGSGNALQELQNYASNLLFSRLGQEKDRLAGFGGLSAYNQAAPGAASAEIGAQKGIYDALGAGAADIFNPPKRYSLEDLFGLR